MIAVFALAALAPASGATVIFYSKKDNSYGWCAGYSYSRGESCAREQCLNYGSGCQLAIECGGGWSATAFPYAEVPAFGASCQFESAASARSIALVSCIYIGHALCYTNETFNGGGSTTSKKTNENFDTAWYTQELLLLLGYDIGEADGDVGSKTRSAIKEVQAAMGVEPDGQASWDLINVLLYVYGGTAKLTQQVIADTDSADQHDVETYSFRYADPPADDLSLGAEIATMDDAPRLRALAAILNYNKAACTMPAQSAIQNPQNPDGWTVSCNEGNYALVATADSVTIDGDTTVVPGPGPDCPTVVDDDTGTDDSDTGPGEDDTVHPGRGTVDPHRGHTEASDNSDSEVDPFKPSPSDIGAAAPGADNDTLKPQKPCPPPGQHSAVDDGDDSDSEVDPFKPSGAIVGAPPPNLGNYTNDADPND